MTKSLAARFFEKVRKEGFAAAVRRAATKPLEALASWKIEILRRFCDPRTIFSYYYRTNKWGNSESRSGAGSTFDNTGSLRVGIERAVRKYGIKMIYDAPCGDFNWMQHVSLPPGARYIGGDIVGELVEGLKARHGRGDRSFILTNIVTDPFPVADLWICRDCLFHLSYAHIFAALKNFCESGIPFALLTTDVKRDENKFENCDITTGGFRRIDLFSPPFCFPKEICEEIDDPADPKRARKLCLWTADQVKIALRNMEKFLGACGGRR